MKKKKSHWQRCAFADPQNKDTYIYRQNFKAVKKRGKKWQVLVVVKGTCHLKTLIVSFFQHQLNFGGHDSKPSETWLHVRCGHLVCLENCIHLCNSKSWLAGYRNILIFKCMATWWIITFTQSSEEFQQNKKTAPGTGQHWLTALRPHWTESIQTSSWRIA